jgi:glycosyltransferase involved in cell wall biosynthesis
MGRATLALRRLHDVYDAHGGMVRSLANMRVLAITQIWPNSVEPLSSSFNLQQFKCLAGKCDLTVLAAVAYVPGAGLLGRMDRPPRPALLDRLPARELIGGIETHYMRQLYVPKIGVPVAVPLYLASLAPYRKLLADADVLLGTWGYPDGCAVVLAARALGKPCAVKVHGSDLNVIAKRPSARAVLRHVLPRAHAMVSVSEALSDELEGLGVPRPRIHLVANGVNTDLFAPRDKGEARRALGLSPTAAVVTFVGRLEPQKGVGELLEAIPRVRARIGDVVFVLIGEGEWTERVKKEAAASNGAIVAPGARPLKEVAQWLAASDVLTLPSWMEGTPNVVLEALASGRPVVATRVGGIPDVLADPGAGRLVPARDARALADALGVTIERVRRGELPPERMRALGPKSWDESAGALFDVLRSIHA